MVRNRFRRSSPELRLYFMGFVMLACFGVLAVSLVGAWWAASPVSYPRWVTHGLVRALPLAALEALALGWLAR